MLSLLLLTKPVISTLTLLILTFLHLLLFNLIGDFASSFF